MNVAFWNTDVLITWHFVIWCFVGTTFDWLNMSATPHCHGILMMWHFGDTIVWLFDSVWMWHFEKLMFWSHGILKCAFWWHGISLTWQVCYQKSRHLTAMAFGWCGILEMIRYDYVIFYECGILKKNDVLITWHFIMCCFDSRHLVDPTFMLW